MLQYLPLNVSGYRAGFLPGEVPLEGAGAARLCPAVGWVKISQVPGNSWSGRNLRWGGGKGLGEAHALPPGSRGRGQGPKCAGRAWRAPRRLWGARSVAHGVVCPFTALSPASASERRDRGMKIFVIPGYRCRPTLGCLASSSIASEGATAPCQVEVLPVLAALSSRAAPGILPGKRREATGPVPEQVLPMQA